MHLLPLVLVLAIVAGCEAPTHSVSTTPPAPSPPPQATPAGPRTPRSRPASSPPAPPKVELIRHGPPQQYLLRNHGARRALTYRDKHGVRGLRFVWESRSRKNSEDLIRRLRMEHVSGEEGLEEPASVLRSFQEEARCEQDILGVYDVGAWSVTDLDGDGEAEVTWAYTMGCLIAQEIDDTHHWRPIQHKVIMIHGPNKLVLRGKTQPGGKGVGKATPNPALQQAPGPWRAHIEGIWTKTSPRQLLPWEGVFLRGKKDTYEHRLVLKAQPSNKLDFKLSVEELGFKRAHMTTVQGVATPIEVESDLGTEWSHRKETGCLVRIFASPGSTMSLTLKGCSEQDFFLDERAATMPKSVSFARHHDRMEPPPKTPQPPESQPESMPSP